MNNFSVNGSLKKRLNVSFLICLSIISLLTLTILIWTMFVNNPDTFNLKRPAPYLLLPIYLIVRLIFFKIEKNKNITNSNVEEIVKFLLFVCFLAIISMKVFPLDVESFIGTPSFFISKRFLSSSCCYCI